MDVPPAQFARTPDGFDIAYAISGSGTPLIFLPLTFSHIQDSWQGESVLRDWLCGLASRFQLVQYDGRGQGMSSRGLPETHSILDEVVDLETIVERLQLERFILMARGPTGHAAIRYAAANPHRVEAMLLFSMPVSGTAWPAAFAARLPAENWTLFLQSFTAFDGRTSDTAASVDRMSRTIDQADWRIKIRDWIASDVEDLLASIPAPALVLHPRGVIQPELQESMRLAAGLPNGRMLVIDGATQLGEPDQGLHAIDQFLGSLSLPGSAHEKPLSPQSQDTEKAMDVAAAVGLTSREIEVLRLIVAGCSNREMADQLVLSLRTVERHVTNIYLKIGAHNKAEATAFAFRNRLNQS